MSIIAFVILRIKLILNVLSISSQVIIVAQSN
mgnify:CR=1 FL=1